MPTIGEVTAPGWLAPLVAGFSAAWGCGGAAPFVMTGAGGAVVPADSRATRILVSPTAYSISVKPVSDRSPASVRITAASGAGGGRRPPILTARPRSVRLR